MHRNLTPHTWMYRNRHPLGKCTDIITLTHECTDIIIPQVNTPESYPSHMNAPRSSSLMSSSLMRMHRYPTPYTWMHRRHHPSSKCTGILPLTHGCTEIVTLQVNATIAYPSHMNAPKSFISQVNAPESYPCTDILPLTNECTENRHFSSKCTNNRHFSGKCTNILYRYPTPHTWKHRNHHPSSKCKRISLTHECTEIIIPQMHRNLTPHKWMHRNRHSTGKCTDILPLTHECTEIIIP